ncbi:MAG: hypothetical protein NC331_16120 [Lachnospiraceae bacterium]|nr:hypothetical protein [Lachnospiraceae bacterium]MCM1240879.1 hypothetical protein [Lachnospiraceae bacterium]
MDKRIYGICAKWIRLIGGCVLLFLVMINLVFSSHVDYQSELVSIENNGILEFIAALLFLGVFFVLSRMAEKMDEKVLFIVLAVAFVTAGICLIANADDALRSDPLYAYQTAAALRGGDHSSLAKGGYLFYFPHQLGLITYERILLLFSSDTKFLFFCNLLEMTGINFFLWRLTDILLKGSHAVNVNVIILSFAFLPQFFFILFAYGLLPGLFCLMAAFFCAAVFVDKGKKRYLVFMTVCSSLAVFLKENYLIGVIALAIWLVLESIRSRRYRLLIAALLLLPCCTVSVKAVQGAYELESGMKMGKGVPALLYIGMGVNPHNEMLGPGWFDGSNWSYFTQCDQDSEMAAEKAKDLLRIYWGQMRDEPLQTVIFFIRKNVSVWCDPMYQSVWSGPLESCGQHMDTKFLQSLYRGEKAEHMIYRYMKGYVLTVLVMSFLFLFKGWKENRGAALLLLYHIGGFLFYMFWEGKSQYTYPYMFVLLPLCAYTLARLSAYGSKRKPENVEDKCGICEEIKSA